MKVIERSTILIVEDDPVAITGLAGILGNTYELVITKSLADAKKNLSEDIDLILLDLHLPDGTGISFLDYVKAFENLAGIPVVCVSSSEMTRTIEQAFKQGAIDYVVKPFNRTILSAKISTFIDLKRKTDLLSAHALSDPLTGIGNRRLFDQKLETELERAKRQNTALGLVLVDVDNFKSLNDTYGHSEGDQCLALLATAMRDTFARTGDVVARLGGDEFAAILPLADLSHTVEIAGRLLQTLKAYQGNSNLLRDHAQPLTVSIGCNSIGPGQYASAQALIGGADRNLYDAKELGGRNCVRPVI
jgi:diguanylate cyclase (GGDEF)-like protein